MILDKDKIKESLSEQDIMLILKDLGSQPPKKDRDNNLIFQTVCHHVSGGSFKLYYYKSSYMFRCYTDCGDSFDVYELVMRAKSIRDIAIPSPQSVAYVAEITGKNYTVSSLNRQTNSFMINDWEFINNYNVKQTPKIELPPFPKQVLQVFRYLPHESWIEEGITWKTMQKYMISYYIKGDKIVIPHFDIKGNLVGVRGRAMLQEDIDAGYKYMPLIVNGQLYNHPTAFNLYGLYENQDTIRKYGKVTLFEGEKSVLKCEDMYEGFNWSLAVCGGSISNWQRDMILALGVSEVIIAFDKEFEDAESEEAKKYAKKIALLCSKFTPYCRVFVLWDTEGLLEYKDSPIDKGKEVFEKLMKSKIEVKTKVPVEEIE